MANLNAPSGLKPVKYLSGAKWNGQVTMYLIASGDGTATFIGDPVKLAGASAAAGVFVNGIDCEGMQTVVQAAAGDTLVGVVVGFLPYQADLTISHRQASVNRIALVVDDPNVIFEIQEDSVGAALAVGDVGENADLIIGSGSATTGVSACMLDSSTHTSSSAQVRIMRLVPRPNNAIGSLAKWEVLINEHQYKSTSGV